MATERYVHICGETVRRLVEGHPDVARFFDPDPRYMREHGIDINMDWESGDVVVAYTKRVPRIFLSFADPPTTPSVPPGVLEYIQGETMPRPRVNMTFTLACGHSRTDNVAPGSPLANGMVDEAPCPNGCGQQRITERSS